MATATPFHQAVVRDPAFISEPFTVHTRWIETEFDNQIPPFVGAAVAGADAEPRETVVVEVGGKRLEVSLPAGLGVSAGGGSSRKKAPKRGGGSKAGSGASGDAVVSPMQGTIVKIAVEEGQTVGEGDLIVVLEAMKMEQPLNAHKAGTVTSLAAVVGEVVTAGTAVCEIKD
jgi:acetyl-CoA/propionyl-CoA carboxylase biotin carboxyl carrier protein